MTVKAEEIATLVELFETSNWDELHVEIDGLQLFLSTDPHARLTSSTAPLVVAPVAAGSAVPVAEAVVPAPRKPAEHKPEPHAEVLFAESNMTAITAPNLGTFYRAPKPGAAPFVEIGQAVDVDTDICLLEVMKLFTTVKAGTKGILRKVCVNDAEMVEFGQTLFYVEPA